jgi:hypothetical protein
VEADLGGPCSGERVPFPQHLQEPVHPADDCMLGIHRSFLRVPINRSENQEKHGKDPLKISAAPNTDADMHFEPVFRQR